MITTIKNNSLVDFEHELSLILNTHSDEVEKAKKIIIFIEDVLKQLTDWLKHHVFETIQEEIKFFKEIKPNIVAKLIFYKEILSPQGKTGSEMNRFFLWLFLIKTHRHIDV